MRDTQDRAGPAASPPRAPREHELKVWSEYFGALVDGSKTFEARFNDRDFRQGDTLLLREFDCQRQVHTGRVVYRTVTYVLHGGGFGISEGYVVLGLAVPMLRAPDFDQKAA